jgi:hypothetical protein
MKNVAFKLMGSLLLVAYGEDAPTHEDHLACLAVFRSMDIEGSRSLCFTRGGGPTAAQRKELHDVLQGRSLPCAVVSDAAMVRGLVTAASWFNGKIKAFSMHQVPEALRYLGIPEGRHQSIMEEGRRLQGMVKGTHDKSARRPAN